MVELVFAFALICMADPGVAAKPVAWPLNQPPEIELNSSQRDAIARRGLELHESALRQSPTDSATIQRFASDAAEQYRLLLVGGLVQPEILINLGHVSMLDGDIPHAIAAYEAAAKLEPGNTRVIQRLEEARQQLKPALGESDWALLTASMNPWHRILDLDVQLVLIAIWWCLGWAAAAWQLQHPRNWRWAVIGGSAFVVTGVGGPIAAQFLLSESRVQCVVLAEVQPRRGDGVMFPEEGKPLEPGQKLVVNRRRENWFEVLREGNAGQWVPGDRIAILPASRWPWQLD